MLEVLDNCVLVASIWIEVAKKRYTKKYISNELYFLRVTQDLPYVNMLGDTPNLLLNAKEK